MLARPSTLCDGSTAADAYRAGVASVEKVHGGTTNLQLPSMPGESCTDAAFERGVKDALWELRPTQAALAASQASLPRPEVYAETSELESQILFAGR